MNLYLKLIGALMLLVCSFLASSEYRRRIFRQTEEYRSVLSLLRHAVDKVHLMDGREAWSGLEDEILESVGILPALRGGQGIRAAFEECKDGLSLDKTTKDMITVQLSKLGDGYTEERAVIEEIIANIKTALADAEANAEKNASVARALLVGGALTVIIMII